MTRLLTAILGLLTMLNITFSSDVTEVLPLTNRIILIHFDDGHIDYYGAHESKTSNVVYSHPLDVSAAAVAANYSLTSPDDPDYANTTNALHVGRKSKGTDFNSQVRSPHYVLEHWVYVEFPNALKRGRTYTITLNGLADHQNEFTFIYNEAVQRSEAIHVNEVGFTPNSPKYAYISQWMGDFNTSTHPDGGLELDDYAGSPFYVVPVNNRSISAAVFNGVIQKRKDKSTTETGNNDYAPEYNYTHADVWECDFSNFTTPGEYVVVVEGMGCSYPFSVGEDVYRTAFYAASRGLFYQRQGVAKEVEPGVVWPRDHHPDDMVWYYDASIENPKKVDRGGSPEDSKPHVAGIWGYYHDAGDWDRVVGHDEIPMQLMTLYLLKPGNFKDGDVGNRYKLANDDAEFIDEGTNGIPDILDEARWLIDYSRRGRHALMDQGLGTGGVPGGYTGREAANGSNPSWDDTKDAWCVSGESATSTFNYAGMAALYGSILKDLGKASAEYQPWIDDAVDAYGWAVNKGNGTAESQAWAAVCLYRATEDASYQDVFKSKFSGGGLAYSISLTWEHSAGVYSLLPADFPGLDVAFQQGTVRNKIISAADASVNPIADRGFRLGMPKSRPFNLGSHNTPRTEIMAIAYAATGEQKYLDAIHTTASYCLGGNETNTCFITQVGENPEKFVFHLDSWFSTDYNSKVYTNPIREGFVSYFGNTVGWVNGDGDELWSQSSLYPEGFENWPKGEGRIQNRNSIAGSEFTVTQSNSQIIFTYGYLCGTSDGSFVKNERPEISISYPAENATFNTGTDITLEVNVSPDVREVRYYYEEYYLGSTTTKPFTYTWKDAPAGTYNITAVAVDDEGLLSEPADAGDVTVVLTDGPGVPATGVSIENCPEGTILLNASYQLTALVDPLEATEKAVTWSSDHPEIITVDENGEIFARDYGSAVITVTTADGGFEATCTINVEPPIDVTAVNFLDCTGTTLGTNSTALIDYEVLPADATNKKVTWSSSDTDVAKVNANGVISGVSPGTAEIAVKTEDGGFTDMCVVTVVQSNSAPTIDQVSDTVVLINSGLHVLDLTGISDGDGGTQNLVIQAVSNRPDIVPDPTVAYVQGENAASLSFQPVTDKAGVVQVEIFLKDDGGTDYNGSDEVKTSFTISVVYSLSLSIPGIIQGEAYTSAVGDVGTGASEDLDGTDYVGWFDQGEELHYDVPQVEKGVYDVTFRIASGTSSNGLLKLRSGSTLLTEVEIPPTGGWLNWQDVQAQIKLDAGRQTIIVEQASVNPFNMNWMEYTKTTIPCCVEILEMTGCPGENLFIDSTVTLGVIVSPADVFDPSVTWTSSDNSVAGVDENGLVTANGEGAATITVTSNDGGYTADCIINVVKNTEGIPQTSSSQAVSLYPNPAHHQVFVENTSNVKKYRVMDIYGRTVILEKTAGRDHTVIDLDGLNRGMYIIEFTNKDQTKYVLKFCKD